MKVYAWVAIVAILWVGMILGIGLESIVKFNTPTLTKPVAFDVGRTVFNAFNKAQLVLLVLLVVSAFVARVTPVYQAGIAVVAVIVILQTIWLFPVLSQRVDIILAGNTPASTYHHAVYGLLEVSKLLLLSALGLRLLWL